MDGPAQTAEHFAAMLREIYGPLASTLTTGVRMLLSRDLNQLARDAGLDPKLKRGEKAALYLALAASNISASALGLINARILRALERSKGAAETFDRLLSAPARRSEACGHRLDAADRLRRMKLRRAGHPVLNARRESGGEYREFEVDSGQLPEYGYPEQAVLLVRTDELPKLGDFVLAEREPLVYEGRAIRLDGDDGLRFGLLGVDGAGNFRLESLTCGPYGYGLKRIIGVVVGSLDESGGEQFPQLPGVASPAHEAAPDVDEWPEYIGTGRAA